MKKCENSLARICNPCHVMQEKARIANPRQRVLWVKSQYYNIAIGVLGVIFKQPLTHLYL